ncbi:MAG: hypothetical protein L0Z62_01160 [Gemmataceae bacterium]|nr:hypothetical protein [Gemmataceae bacterium]
MANGDMIADSNRVTTGRIHAVRSGVDYAPVLNISALADDYRVHVPTSDSHRPKRAVRADRDIADYNGGSIDEGGRRDPRRFVPVNPNLHAGLFLGRIPSTGALLEFLSRAGDSKELP